MNLRLLFTFPCIRFAFMKSIPGILTCLWLAFAVLPLLGAPPEEEEEGPSYVLEEVTVTASRYERSIFETARAVNLISSKKLSEWAPWETANALLEEPGIWVVQSGYLYGSPIIRGLEGNRILLLFNGIRRNTAGLFPGPNWYLNNIDPFSVKRIEVIRGPGSVLYGSDALGGVINVITLQDPLFTEEIQVRNRSFMRVSSADKGVGGRTEIRFRSPVLFGVLGGSWKRNDSIEGGRGDGLLEPSRSRQGNWDLQVDWLAEELHRFEFFFQRYHRPPTRRYDQPMWRQEDERSLYAFRYTGEFGSDWLSGIHGTLYFQEQDTFIDEEFFDADSRDDTVGFEMQADFSPLEEWRLIAGLHFHRDRVKNAFPSLQLEDAFVTWDNPALFLLSEYPLSSRLRLDLGARWDRTTFDSDPPAEERIPEGLTPEDIDLRETHDAPTGSLGLVYSVTDQVNWVGSISRAFRSPNKQDLLSYGQSFRGFQVPSPELDPESSWTCETGLRIHSSRLSGNVTYFYTKLRNFIESVPGTFNGKDYVDLDGDNEKDPGEEVFVKRNAGKAYVHGVELQAAYRLDDCWSLFGNFTWMYGRNRTSDEPIERGIPLNGLLGIRWEDSPMPEKQKYWVECSAQMVSKFDRIPDQRLATDPAYRRNPQDRDSGLLRGDGSIPGYTILNLRGGMRLWERGRLTLGIENLFDRRYRPAHSRMNGPGINFFAALEVEF